MKSPRLSINKLSEYMTATPSRRKQILRDQQRPSTFKAGRYNDARTTIINVLSGITDEDEAMSKVEALYSSGGRTKFQKQDRECSAEAIENFLDVLNEIDIAELSVEAGDAFSDARLEIGGVSITMRPDAMLKDPSTKKVVGCLKLHFSKTHPLGQQGCEYAATALRHHLDENVDNSDAHPKKCYVVDVPSGKVYSAPQAYKRRMNDISAACEEINARWSTI